ncbi:hypothetical protein NC651_004497 [Populus alba x Populus x berolinensis]|nr:hypothetical protein NC651_004497 [Populus alba x Populus x berolinensis]
MLGCAALPVQSPRVASDLFLTEEFAPRAKKRRLCSSSCTNNFFGNEALKVYTESFIVNFNVIALACNI